MFSVAHAQAESQVGDGIIRDDRQALLNILEVVRALNRAEKTGENTLSADDVHFLRNANEQIARYGFAGGLVGGGSTLFLLRNANKWFKFSAAVSAWVVWSAVGRFSAVDASLEKMLNQLPADSQLRKSARKVVSMYAEENGYFARRYNLNVLDAAADNELRLNTWRDDRDKFANTSAAPEAGSTLAESLDMAGDDSDAKPFDMHAYFDENDNGSASTGRPLPQGEGAKTVGPSSAQVSEPQQRPSNEESSSADPFDYGESSDNTMMSLPLYKDDYDEMLMDEQMAMQSHKQPPGRTWDDVRKDYYAHHQK